jgi:ketosteroid isomerase-like protein
MSKENADRIRRGFEAVLNEDWEGAFAGVDSQVEIRDWDIPDADVYRGRDGYFAWLARWGESWERWRIENLEVRAVGDDRAIALFDIVATGKGSGVELTRHDAITYTLAHGKVIRFDYYNDQGRALEAVGLSE